MSEQTKQLHELTYSEVQQLFFNASVNYINAQSQQIVLYNELQKRATQDKDPKPTQEPVVLPKLKKLNLPS